MSISSEEEQSLPWNLDSFAVKEPYIKIQDLPYLTGFAWSTKVKADTVP